MSLTAQQDSAHLERAEKTDALKGGRVDPWRRPRSWCGAGHLRCVAKPATLRSELSLSLSPSLSLPSSLPRSLARSE